jgi:hypothetical protein
VGKRRAARSGSLPASVKTTPFVLPRNNARLAPCPRQRTLPAPGRHLCALLPALTLRCEQRYLALQSALQRRRPLYRRTDAAAAGRPWRSARYRSSYRLTVSDVTVAAEGVSRHGTGAW